MSNSTVVIKYGFLTDEEQKALKEYQKYKELRTVVVKPIRAFNGVDAILKDLQGEGFSLLEKEIERVKKSRTKTITNSRFI